jgi:hypothetical protein
VVLALTQAKQRRKIAQKGLVNPGEARNYLKSDGQFGKNKNWRGFCSGTKFAAKGNMKTISRILWVGLALALLLQRANAQTSTNTVVSVVAAEEGLSPLQPEDVPLTGTFWVTESEVSDTYAVPWPCPPPSENAIYSMPNGAFLVDDTTNNASTMTPAAITADATPILDLIDMEQAQATAASLAMGGGFHADDLASAGGGGDGDGSGFTISDIGTNLWIAQWAMTNNTVTGIASNSLADVQYEILSTTNLAGTNNWVSDGFFIGSETTNWTPLNVLPVISTNNVCFRLRSWVSSDGSGIPDWWEELYFGTTGINPNAQDAAGDGWTIYQKFQMRLNPNVFYTPAAPQGLSVSLNSSNGQAVLSWQPSSGDVTNYLVTKIDYQTGLTTNFDVSLTADDLLDDLSGDQPSDLQDSGPGLEVDYSVVAQYSDGNSSTANVSLGFQSPPTVIAMRGSRGNLNLIVSGLPADVASIKVYRARVPSMVSGGYYDLGAEIYQTIGEYLNYVAFVPDPLTNGYFEISSAGITDGIYPVPTNQASPFGSYHFWIQGERANGTNTEWSQSFISDWTAYNGPFVDARQQLKDNLRFVLRAASQSNPFQFEIQAEDSPHFAWPTNYAFAGLYNSGMVEDWGSFNNFLYFDEVRPIAENFELRNFAFDGTNCVNSDGSLSTGIYYQDDNLYINGQPTMEFDVSSLLGTAAPTIPASLLTPQESRWIAPIQENLSDYPTTGGARNLYGLPYHSVNNMASINGQLYSTIYSPVSIITNGSAYYETAQPGFTNAGYYFARANYGNNIDPMPEDAGFATTNTTPMMIFGVGQLQSSSTMPNQIAAYAKLAVTNGYSGTYGYLGQYFDKAYSVDTNGNATTNTTGVLSPYGEFIATQPGPAALTTMPDPDTAEQGTCTVYCVSLNLDKNHDGTIDTSFNGPDFTTANSPFIFWANNNYDRYVVDPDDNAFYDDDVQVQDSPGTSDQNTPDCNYRDGAGNRVISCARDLQDFARLWVSGVTTNLLAALPAGSKVTLNWGDVGYPNSGNPTIDLFAAADVDGGISYLTNSSTAESQVDSTYCPCIGRLGPGSNIVLNASAFANNWAGNHFIWCGVSNGTGGLNLTIADGSGNVLAQTTVYIQIEDIKQMYERWTVGDQGSTAPLTNAVLAADDGLPTNTPAFQYSTPENTNTPYILYVHGWNMEIWEKDRFAESAFKRLFWQGYQGRFGSFRWPTYNGFTGSFWQALTDSRNFDNSELIAWQSAAGLVNKLVGLNTEYPGHVYMLAHSMGNVVAGEALRLAAQNGAGQIVNTYVASQAALSAHNYDATVTTPYLLPFTYTYPTEPLETLLGNRNYGPNAPDIYGNRLTNNIVAVGKRINFYNTNDFALAMPRWGFDQITKPDYIPPNNFYAYSGSLSDPAPWNKFVDSPIVGGDGVLVDIVTNLNNLYTIMAYAAPSYSTALGATPNVLNVSANFNLTTVWPPDPTENNYTEHFWHSAEFRGDCWQEWNYWNTLLFSPSLGFNISAP